MKKILSMIVALVMFLTLCACRGEKLQDTADDTTTDILVEVVETQMVETTILPTEPEIQEIEITLDNWKDYFEYKEFLFCQKNAFGDFTDYLFFWCLMPKDSIGTIVGSSVVVAYDYKIEMRRLTVYPDTNTFEWGDFSTESYPYFGSGAEKVEILYPLFTYSVGEIETYGVQLARMGGDQETLERASYYTFDVTRIEGILKIQK